MRSGKHPDVDQR